MNFISSMLVAFCATSVFIGMLYILCPEKAMEKPTKYILSLVFLVSIIASAGIISKNEDFSLPEITQSEISSDELDIANAKMVFAYALKSASIDFSEISVYTDKLSDGSISINKVLIYSEHPYGEIQQALSDVTEKTEVVVINE